MKESSSFQTLDHVQSWILQTILTHGQEVSPRGMKTREIFPVTFSLLNPRSRCITNPARRWKFPAAVGEFAWHVGGSRDVSFISYYLERWAELAGDSSTVNGSCYGYKIFGNRIGGLTQWDRLVELLRSDPDSRRGVLSFQNDNANLEPEAPDQPCACILHFMVREGRVYLTVYMRSNDAIWGLPYDVFLFTMLQELLACQLSLKLGSYSHTVGSMHLYEHHLHLAERIISSPYVDFEMPPMEEHWQLNRFLECEHALRTELNERMSLDMNSYWGDLVKVLAHYRNIKKRTEAKNFLPSENILYRPLLKIS